MNNLKRYGSRLLALAGCSFVAACATPATPTYFIAPTMSRAVEAPPAPSPSDSASATAEPQALPTVFLPSPTPPCIDNLQYLDDLTIPDGSVVSPGQEIDKRWRVMNSGTCNWDDRYQLRLVGGDSMGAPSSMMLFPARAGTEATLRIVFVAPPAPGTYQCQWQAVDPSGAPFGDTFYMQVIVAG